MQKQPSTETATPRSQASSIPEEHEETELRNRFEIKSILGKGAYGTVYKAVDISSGEHVAIKVIPLTEADPAELQQIQKEIAFLAGCDHPNVVRYIGSYKHRHELWIVMEYCGGGSIGDLIAASGQGLPEDVIAYICCESLKGLAYLHSRGKVHRDIKCGNILLSDTGQVKLADFGVSAQLTNTMSKRQTFIGTPHWMAPEVIQESRYDGKVDVWALAISAIEMAETVPPRWNVHPLRVIFMISRDPPPKLTDPSKWTPVFGDFLTQALTKDASLRPTAKYLLQHRFTMIPRPTAAALLLQLIERSREYLAAQSAPAPTLPSTHKIRDVAGMATGKFSWRGKTMPSAPPATDGPLQPEPSESPVAPGNRMQRSRLSPLAQSSGTVVERPSSASRRSSESYDMGTVVVKDYGNTMVVNDASGTVVVRRQDSGPASPFFEAANTLVLADRNPDDTGGGGYMAAVKNAAAQAMNESKNQIELAKPKDAPSPKNDMDRTKARLLATYEGGLVVPLPFLKASEAQPLALLKPLGVTSSKPAAVDGVDADAYEVVLSLVQQSAALNNVQPGGPQEAQQITALPPHIIRQLLTHPQLQNLARTQAFHLRSLQLLPLDRTAKAQLQQAIDDISDALRCIMCL